MPNYEWICKECNAYWDRDCSIGKAPDRTRCPNCNKLSERYWQNSNVGISFKDDGCGNKNSTAGDFHTVKQRYRKFEKEGFDQDSANTFLHRSIRESKERLDDESMRYKPVYLRPDKLVESGRAKKLNDKEVSRKINSARKLTEHTYDKAKLDPNHPTKQY